MQFAILPRMATKEPTPPQPTAQELKKEAYLKYIQQSPVVDELAKVLAGLYELPQRPENPIEHSARFLGLPADINPERMVIELGRLREQNAGLKKRLQDVNHEIADFLAKKEEQ